MINNSSLKTKNKFGRIGVLMGGPSTERDISFKSGKAVYDGLKAEGLNVVPVDIISDNPEDNKRKLRSLKLDIAFIALHGTFGEDGGIQSILEDLKIPFTGSGVMASKLAMDKAISRVVFELEGLLVPKGQLLHRLGYRGKDFYCNRLSFPVVVKPVSNGSSIGLSIVQNKRRINKAIELAFSYDERVIIEEYVRGREITVGIVDNSPLPIVEVVPKKYFYDFDAKYKPGLTDYLVPANFSKKITKKIQSVALCAHQVLGCAGFSRVDMIWKDGRAYILEVNTIPGFTETSLLPKASAARGIGFNQLCVKLLELASKR